MLFSFAGPLLLSFDKKVAFYKKWPLFLPGMPLTAFLFLIWDYIFTEKGVWGFNPDYLLGVWVGNLPLEEIMFFFVVPFACVFIYECVLKYGIYPQNPKIGRNFLLLVALLLLVAAFANSTRTYTFFNFLFCSLFIFFVLRFSKSIPPLQLNAFLIAYLISLGPFLLVNGVLTAMPIVWYNPQENLGIRLGTIPIEDTFYGLLLMLMNVWMYELRRSFVPFRKPLLHP